MTFDEWWDKDENRPPRSKDFAPTLAVVNLARKAWEAGQRNHDDLIVIGPGGQLVGAHGSLMDKLGDAT